MAKGNQSSSRSSSVNSSLSNDENNQRYKRLKLDSSSEESPSSTDMTINPSINSIKTQSAFVNKLYKMLEDSDTSHLIAWSSHGDLFSVSNPTAFSKTILPLYFKHNNWQSFVRQLNMYGFHKVNDLIHSNLTNENQTWEFKHPNFKRGEISNLQHIKRKSTKSQQIQLQQQKQKHKQTSNKSQSTNHTNSHPNIPTTNHNTSKPQQDEDLKKHISRIEDHLIGVSKTCEQLFNEVVHLRMVVSKQQDAMQDLVDIVSISTKPDYCNCSDNSNDNSNNNNNNNNNKQELQNAENLRLQVSKLKDKKASRKTSSPYSDYDQKSSESSFTTRNYNPNSDQSKALSSKMSFGKQSHMLNPIKDQQQQL